MFKKIVGVAAVLALLLILGVVLGFRDTPIRQPVGAAATTTSGAATIEYYRRGPDDGDVVVLLASYARSVADFNELVPALNQAGYRTLAIQARGVEGSSLPDTDMTLHRYAADVRAVLDKERIGSAKIIGHAYGNRIARTFAHDYPERSHGLVLLAAGGEKPTPSETSRAIIKAQFSLLPYRSRREAVRSAFFAKGNAVPPWWVEGWYPKAGFAQARAAKAMGSARTDPAWTAAGNAPMVILEPAKDAAAAGAGDVLRRRFPGRVQLHILKDTGHALLPEKPEWVARLVIDALSNFSPPAGP